MPGVTVRDCGESKSLVAPGAHTAAMRLPYQRPGGCKDTGPAQTCRTMPGVTVRGCVEGKILVAPGTHAAAMSLPYARPGFWQVSSLTGRLDAPIVTTWVVTIVRIVLTLSRCGMIMQNHLWRRELPKLHRGNFRCKKRVFLFKWNFYIWSYLREFLNRRSFIVLCRWLPKSLATKRDVVERMWWRKETRGAVQSLCDRYLNVWHQANGVKKYESRKSTKHNLAIRVRQVAENMVAKTAKMPACVTRFPYLVTQPSNTKYEKTLIYKGDVVSHTPVTRASLFFALVLLSFLHETRNFEVREWERFFWKFDALGLALSS